LFAQPLFCVACVSVLLSVVSVLSPSS
jgi:hypothetical protein